MVVVRLLPATQAKRRRRVRRRAGSRCSKTASVRPFRGRSRSTANLHELSRLAPRPRDAARTLLGDPWLRLNEFTRSIVVRHLWRALEGSRPARSCSSTRRRRRGRAIDATFDDQGSTRGPSRDRSSAATVLNTSGTSRPYGRDVLRRIRPSKSVRLSRW